MFNTFFTPTAESIPISTSTAGLEALNIQDAVTKLAFLIQALNTPDKNGDLVFRIGASPTSVVLPGVTGKWRVNVTDEGIITTDLLPSSDLSLVTYWTFKNKAGNTISIEVDDDGEIIMVESLNSFGYDIRMVYLSSPSNALFGLGITEDGEFFTDDVQTAHPSFKVVSQLNQVLCGTVQHDNLALNYLPVYEIDALPTSPVSVNQTLPWVFVRDTLGVKRPVFHDGQDWRYFSGDQIVSTGGAP